MLKYLAIFLVSMVPIIELRGAIPISQGLGLPIISSYIICIIGNMIPVPFIYLFARRLLEWGKDTSYTGKCFPWGLEKGERGGTTLGGPATRNISCFTSFCRHTSSGNGSLDRDFSSQYFRYGF